MEATSRHSGFARRVAAGILRHPLAVGAFVVVLTAAGIWRVSTLDLDADMIHLLDRDDPVLEAYRRLKPHMPASEALFLVFPPGRADKAQEVEDPIEALENVRAAIDMGSVGPHRDRAVFALALAGKATDIEAVSRTVRDVRRIVREAGTEVGMTGSPAFLVQARQALSADLRRASLIAVAGVALLFLVFYRIGWIALFSFVPVGLGLVWGLGATSLFTDRITLLASVVPTLLIGLGIDYCIHLLQAAAVRGREEASGSEMAGRAFAAVARPLTVGAITTAVAFFSMTSASLDGLVQMGLVGGLCVLGVFACVMLLFPLLLARCPSRWLEGKGIFEPLLVSAAPAVIRGRAHVVAATLIVSGVSVSGLAGLSLGTDLNRLQNPSLPALRLQEELAEEAGISTAPLMVEFGTEEAAEKFSARVPGDPAVAHARGVSAPNGGVALVHPAGNAFCREGYARLEESVRSAARATGTEPLSITGAPAVNARLVKVLAGDLPRVTLVAVAAVLVCLVIGFGGLRPALLALVPLACALAWTGGAMGLAGVPLSVMTVAVAPLIVGVGVDDGVHILRAWQRHEGDLSAVFRRTGVAVVATTLTTVAAFGSLMSASTRGLVQFGWQACLGLALCMIVSLAVLPLACRLVLPGAMDSPKKP